MLQGNILQELGNQVTIYAKRDDLAVSQKAFLFWLDISVLTIIII